MNQNKTEINHLNHSCFVYNILSCAREKILRVSDKSGSFGDVRDEGE